MAISLVVGRECPEEQHGISLGSSSRAVYLLVLATQSLLELVEDVSSLADTGRIRDCYGSMARMNVMSQTL